MGSKVTPSQPNQKGNSATVQDGMSKEGHAAQANKAGNKNAKEQKEEK